MGRIFGLKGLKKKEKRQEALKSHCRPSPLLLYLLLLATWPLSLLGVHVCVCVCMSLHLHPVLVACPWLHHWRQLMLSHGSIVAAPAANNQRQLFGKYQRCLIGSTDGLDSLFTIQATSHVSNKMLQINY